MLSATHCKASTLFHPVSRPKAFNVPREFSRFGKLKRCCCSVNKRREKGFWRNPSNQREMFDRIGEQLGVKKLDDWYCITSHQVKSMKATFITEYYNSSLIAALRSIYPHQNWNPLLFKKVPQSHWKDKENRREYLELIGRELGVKELDDWYNITTRQLKEKKATFITHYYNGSLAAALEELYPHHKWDPLRFSRAPHSHWKEKDNQKECLERIGRELGVKQLDDWYSITTDQVIAKNSTILTNYYNGSLGEALQALYPNHPWDPLRFLAPPKGYWQNESTQQKFRELFRKWKEQHGIKNMRDWYNLHPKDVHLFQRASYAIFGSVSAMLNKWFPETNWTAELQSSTTELDLQFMMRLVSDDVKVHHKIGEFSVDIYIPEWNLAIEYQGGQHFKQTWRGDLKSQLLRDKNKEQYLQRTNASLVTVNHTWTGSWSQLRATVRHTRPDLLLIKQPSDNFPNHFAENITLKEVTKAIKGNGFFRRIDWGTHIAFDYDQSFPMIQYKKVFKDPRTAEDASTKRLRQILRYVETLRSDSHPDSECRGIKFSPSGELLCRPFHKFFNLNEMPEVQFSTLNIDQVECITEKYDGKLIAPVMLNKEVVFLTRGGAKDSVLNRYLASNHIAFAQHVISMNKTPIFEHITKNSQSSVRYGSSSLILLTIRDNNTGEYSSYQSIKEEAAAYDIIVAKEWPVPNSVDKLKLMKQEIKDIEGFVIKLYDGTLIKWKTDWWRQQRVPGRKSASTTSSAIL